MSVKVMTWVWDNFKPIVDEKYEPIPNAPEVDTVELLALLFIADQCNDNGNCIPSMKLIAKSIRRNERTARRVLSKLEKEGYIWRQQRRIARKKNYSNRTWILGYCKAIGIEKLMVDEDPEWLPPNNTNPQKTPKTKADTAMTPLEGDTAMTPYGGHGYDPLWGTQLCPPMGDTAMTGDPNTLDPTTLDPTTLDPERERESVAGATPAPPDTSTSNDIDFGYQQGQPEQEQRSVSFVVPITPPVMEEATKGSKEIIPPAAAAATAKQNQPGGRAPTPTTRAPRAQSWTWREKVHAAINSSPHLTAVEKQFNLSGNLPEGIGTNALQVWYEWFSILDPKEHWSAKMEDELVRTFKDLTAFRNVVITFARKGYARKTNFELLHDWYRDPSKMNAGSPASDKTTTNQNNGANHDQPSANPATTNNPDKPNEPEPGLAKPRQRASILPPVQFRDTSVPYSA